MLEAKAKALEKENALKAEKIEAQAKALEKTNIKSKEVLQEIAKAREEGRAEALKEANLAKMKSKDDDDKKKKHHDDKKKKHHDKHKKKYTEDDLKKAKEDAEKNLPACAANGDPNGRFGKDSRDGGTNVFNKEINATNAVGLVGRTNWSINTPPYEVQRCDQILLIHGKKLDMNDYCEKEDSFMTLSIYMINFFEKKDVNKLIDSYWMKDITSIPTPIQGAPACVQWTTKTKSYPFCYESKAIMKQIIDAYYFFLNCVNPRERRLAWELMQNCNVARMNFTEAGPFGKQGPILKEIIAEADPNIFKTKEKPNLDGINPYYINRHGELEIPGYQPKPKRRMIMLNGKSFFEY